MCLTGCLTRTYNAFCNYLWASSEPVKPKLPSNDEIQARLSQRSGGAKDFSRSAKFWDEFASDGKGDSFDDSLQEALQYCNRPGYAYDLGSGVGNDTRSLLARNWQVTAVEISAKAVLSLKSTPSKNLRVVNSPLEDFQFAEKADLILAMNVLAFCDPGKIKDIWDRMYAALNQGAILMCTLPTPHGAMFAKWSLSRSEAQQFFLDDRFKLIKERTFDEDPYTDHPLFLILQKI